MNDAENTVHENISPVNLTPKESKRFWDKVQKTDSCWLWTGSLARYGYFRFRGKIIKAHRLSFLIHGGTITKEKPNVLHNCPDGDNAACVNPSHLWTGTQTENILDMEAKGRAKHPTGDASGMRTCPESILRGSKNQNAKLTESIVEEIFYSCRNGSRGMKQKTADRLGVSRGLIGHIVNGRAWNHVTGLPRRK